MSKKYSITEFNKIAIIQTAFIGDVALTLPLVDSIKEKNPNAEIIFVTTPQPAELASLSENVSRVISYDKKGLNEGLRGIKFISQLLNEVNVDCIISPHRSLRSSLLTFFAKPEFSVSFNKSALSLIYDKRINYKLHLHEIERNFSLLSSFSDEFKFVDLNQVKLEIQNEDKDYIDSLLSKLDNIKKNIILAPGSIWLTKRWLPEYFRELIINYQDLYNVILIGSKKDIDLCNEISLDTNAKNFAGLTSFAQSIYLLSKSALLITNDSSPTHLAGLTNCPTLTIYGPTSPNYGFYPRAEKSISIAKDDLKCHPCHIHGKNICPIKTFDCMKQITPELIINGANNII